MLAESNQLTLCAPSPTTQNDAELEWLVSLAAALQAGRQQSAERERIASKQSQGSLFPPGV